MFPVLRQRDFRRLYATRLSSQTGDGIFQVALAAYIIFNPESQPTAGKVAVAFSTVLLPYSVVGPFAGVLIDRWRRQRILVVGNLVRSIMVLAVAGLVLSGGQGLLFFGGVLLCLSVNRFFLASLSAALPHVVERDELVTANSLSTTSGTLVALVGAAVGYGIRQLVGDGDGGSAFIMAAAALAYAGSALVANRMDRDLLGPDASTSVRESTDELRNIALGLVAGARHVLDRRPAAHALAAISINRFFYGLSTVATLLLYRNYFHSSSDVDAGLSGFAVVLAASAAGYFVAALITPWGTRRWSERGWLIGMLGAAGVAELAFGLPYTQPALTVAAFVIGISAQGSKITVDTIVQKSVDDAFRGRVFTFYDICFNVAFVLACITAAVALPATGKSYPVVLLTGIGYLLTAGCYAWRSAGRPPAREHCGVPPAPLSGDVQDRHLPLTP